MNPELSNLIGSTRRRMRLQRALQGAALGATAGITLAAAALLAFKLQLVDGEQLRSMLGLGALLALLAPVVLALRRISIRHVASQIDRAYDPNNRLCSAIEFSQQPAATGFMKAHVAQTERQLADLSPHQVYPHQLPHAWWTPAVALLGLGAAALADFTPHPTPTHPPQPALAEPIQLDPRDLRQQQTEAKRLAQLLGTDSPTSLRSLATQLDQLVKDLQGKRLTREETFRRIATLAEELETDDLTIWRRIEDRLRALARKLQRSESTSRLGDALQAPDLPRAATEVEQLAKQLPKMSTSAARRLAKALDDAARPPAEDSRLARRTRQLQRQIRRLNRQRSRRPGDQRALRRLRQAERQLKRINRRRDALGAAGRQLQRINQTLARASSELLRRASDKAIHTLRRLAKQLRHLAPTANTARAATRARDQLAELKELLRRLSQSRQNRLALLRNFQQRAHRTESSRASSAEGSAPGSSTDPTLKGPKSKLESRGQREELTGDEGNGPSSSDVIEAAAQREGFAARGYRRVYDSYHDASIDDIRREDVPLGRRQIVKWYFDLIKPAEVEKHRDREN